MTAGWPPGVQAITLFVDDLVIARDFYARAFDTTTIFDDADSAVFRLGETFLNLLRSAAAPELVAPAEPGRSGNGPRSVITLGVEDVDVTVAALRQRGVEMLNGPMDRPWGPRTASFVDPSGHVWEIAG